MTTITYFNVSKSSVWAVWLLLTLVMFSLCACQPAPQTKSLQELEEPNHDKQQVLRIYNWTEYMPQQIIANFEKETGIEVIYHTYSSNEEMYDTLTTAKSSSYDLIVPSSYYVDKLITEGQLQPIDKAQLDHFAQLNPKLIDTKIDPNNAYSVPYLWGTTGIGVNSDTINPQSISSWNDLWQNKHGKQLLLTKDYRETFGMALLSLGYSANSENPEEIKQAYQKLSQLIPYVCCFDRQAVRLPYMQHKANIGMIWNGEVYTANTSGMPTLQYIYPKEGAVLWLDSFAIPKQAKNVAAAHRFINFVLRAENAQIISRQLGYATPNLGARMFMPDSHKNNAIIYPPADVFAKAHLQTAISEEALALYESYWQKLIQQYNKQM